MDAADKRLLLDLLAKKGSMHQITVAMGELSELLSELAKDLRGVGDEWRIVDEIADVGVVLDQLRLMYDPTGAREALYRGFKLRRVQLRNIEGERP